MKGIKRVSRQMTEEELTKQATRAAKYATYVGDLLNFSFPRWGPVFEGHTISELAAMFGWVMGAMMAQLADPQEGEILDFQFNTSVYLAKTLTPRLIEVVRTTGQWKDGPEFKLLIPAPSQELTEKPRIEFYMQDPVGPTQ